MYGAACKEKVGGEERAHRGWCREGGRGGRERKGKFGQKQEQKVIYTVIYHCPRFNQTMSPFLKTTKSEAFTTLETRAPQRNTVLQRSPRLRLRLDLRTVGQISPLACFRLLPPLAPEWRRSVATEVQRELADSEMFKRAPPKSPRSHNWEVKDARDKAASRRPDEHPQHSQPPRPRSGLVFLSQGRAETPSGPLKTNSPSQRL